MSFYRKSKISIRVKKKSVIYFEEEAIPENDFHSVAEQYMIMYSWVDELNPLQVVGLDSMIPF